MKKGIIKVWERKMVSGKPQIEESLVLFRDNRSYKLAVGWMNGGGSMEKSKFYAALDNLKAATGIRDYQMYAYAFAHGVRYAGERDAAMLRDSMKKEW